jgi:hypothetical protein
MSALINRKINMPVYTLAIHGGAGTIVKEDMTRELELAYQESLKSALDAGYAVLEEGGSAINAIKATIVIMEDNILFNAGRGAVFTKKGVQEMDAQLWMERLWVRAQSPVFAMFVILLNWLWKSCKTAIMFFLVERVPVILQSNRVLSSSRMNISFRSSGMINGRVSGIRTRIRLIIRISDWKN